MILLMMQLDYLTWIRLAIWIAVGKTVFEMHLLIYSRQHSLCPKSPSARGFVAS